MSKATTTTTTAALRIARTAIKQAGGRRNIRTPRVIPIPKVGGLLPLIPLFAGLSAVGALLGGSAGVAKTVIDAQKGKKELQETSRHNQTMEAIALGKQQQKFGSGLYLKRRGAQGFGLYLHKQKN